MNPELTRLHLKHFLKKIFILYWSSVANNVVLVLGVQPLWRIIWRFLKELKIELPYDSATPLLGIYKKKNMV